MNRYRVCVQNLDKPELKVTVNLRAIGEITAQIEALDWCFKALHWNRLLCGLARLADRTELDS